jgi:hypothetical protein
MECGRGNGVAVSFSIPMVRPLREIFGKSASQAAYGSSDQARSAWQTLPQGLKPAIFCCIYGTTKVVP